MLIAPEKGMNLAKDMTFRNPLPPLQIVEIVFIPAPPNTKKHYRKRSISYCQLTTLKT